MSVATEASIDNTQASTATTHIQNLKHKILQTVCQEMASLIQPDIKSIQQELRTVQQTLNTKIDQQNTVMHQFQQNVTTVQAKFEQTMKAQFIEINTNHTNLQQQMDAFFAHFAQMLPPYQPPSGQPEGSAH